MAEDDRGFTFASRDYDDSKWSAPSELWPGVPDKWPTADAAWIWSNPPWWKRLLARIRRRPPSPPGATYFISADDGITYYDGVFYMNGLPQSDVD